MTSAQSAQRPRGTHRSQLERAAVGYARRSTDKQEQSIPDQQRAIERYCQDNGLVLQRWFIDDAISGTRASNRPAFQDMVHAAGTAGRDFGLVVVYDVKRFGRLDNDEAGFYRHTLRQHGVEVLYVADFVSGAMLAGIVILGHAAGTFLLSELVAAPPHGTAVAVAVVLVLVGALSKSAIVPFHF